MGNARAPSTPRSTCPLKKATDLDRSRRRMPRKSHGVQADCPAPRCRACHTCCCHRWPLWSTSRSGDYPTRSPTGVRRNWARPRSRRQGCRCLPPCPIGEEVEAAEIGSLVARCGRARRPELDLGQEGERGGVGQIAVVRRDDVPHVIQRGCVGERRGAAGVGQCDRAGTECPIPIRGRRRELDRIGEPAGPERERECGCAGDRAGTGPESV